MNNNNQRRVIEFSDLNLSVKSTANYFKSINKQFKRLKQVNDSLTDFNEAFSAFLFGMAANDTTIEWANAPTDDTIQKHKDHAKRLRSHEVEKSLSTPQTTATKSTPVNAPTTSRKKLKTANGKAKVLISDRQFFPKINAKKVIENLPLKYREHTDSRKYMETVIKVLGLHPSGLTTKDLVTETKLAQYMVAECIGALTHAKEIIKTSEKGQYSKFLLDPSKYPSGQRE